jgi:hypothetical protein
VLHLTVIASIFVSVFVDDIQAFVESKLVSSRLDHNNLDLRAAARAQLRLQAQAGVAPFDDEAFYRHTRRALSDFGNLPKLISNPLMNLPFVSSAITETRSADNPLERAKILKAAVKDAVLRLKPESDKMFDETDEWRFFNALYYPYVIGLRPYSHKLRLDDLNSDSKLALEWFQTSVPERTLYNWQKSAAMLVAQQLRENTPDETF